jgi:hypothetical protein
VDPVSWDGDRHDVSTAGERVDLADYEVLWNGGDPNSAWALDSGVVWVRWVGDTDPVNDSMSNQIPDRQTVDILWTYLSRTSPICRFIWARMCRANVQFPFLSSYNQICVADTSHRGIWYVTRAAISKPR